MAVGSWPQAIGQALTGDGGAAGEALLTLGNPELFGQGCRCCGHRCSSGRPVTLLLQEFGQGKGVPADTRITGHTFALQADRVLIPPLLLAYTRQQV